MAAMVRWMVRARRSSLPSQLSLLQTARHHHTQNLWEQLLGRKIEPSVVKALEEAFLEFKVSQSVPSWLPFLPNSSFWIPSSEDTMKSLESLAERIQRAPRARRKSKVPSFQASPELCDDGISSSKALETIQVMDQLLDRLKENPIENGTKILLVEAEDDEDDENDDDDDGDEDEDEDDHDDSDDEDEED